jgi:hypothetical protein
MKRQTKSQYIGQQQESLDRQIPIQYRHHRQRNLGVPCYQPALKAGIEMARCRIEKIMGNYHTFFTKHPLLLDCIEYLLKLKDKS